MKKPTPGNEIRELRDFAGILRGRRTINLYLQTAIPLELVRDAVETATWAPNHHVTEPWHFYVLGDDTIGRCLGLVRKMVTQDKGEEAGRFKAESWSQKPGWIVITCRKSEDELRQREDYAACAAAVQTFMLYMHKAGVGSKWTTGDLTRDARFADIIGFDPASEFVVGLVWYGYPKVTPIQTRKGLADVLTELP
ncbi:MAG: nitroreductase [Woeseiaceae bacterium]